MKTKLKQKWVQRILSKLNHFWIASPTLCVTFFVNLFFLSWMKYFVNSPFNHFYKCAKHCKFSLLANVWYSQESYDPGILNLRSPRRLWISFLQKIFTIKRHLQQGKLGDIIPQSRVLTVFKRQILLIA